MSIVFDRAVDYYDKTRALPQDRHEALIRALISETGVKPADTVLEIGIGTGRIALSVAEHVHRLYGVDLSQEMLSALRRKITSAHALIDLAPADAVYLPFPTATFDLVYAVHVYHLVNQWRAGIAEAWRVIKPGGHFVVSFHKRDENSPNSRLRKQMHVFAKELGLDTRRPGSQTEEETLEEISKWDPQPKVVQASAWQEPEIPAKILEELDRQIYSETWAIPRDKMDLIIPRLREWAEHTYEDTSREILTNVQTRWLVATKRV